jgi:hypothetical protein
MDNIVINSKINDPEIPDNHFNSKVPDVNRNVKSEVNFKSRKKFASKSDKLLRKKRKRKEKSVLEDIEDDTESLESVTHTKILQQERKRFRGIRAVIGEQKPHDVDEKEEKNKFDGLQVGLNSFTSQLELPEAISNQMCRGIYFTKPGC